jgi:8-oxo-dGTP diphosphatase
MTDMELCDVVDQYGNRTGRFVERGTELTSGEFYLVVHVWIRDKNNHYLIQQRAFHLASGPGVWATTVGYVLSGEESISGALREVTEELGLQLSVAHIKRFDSHTFDNRFEDVWVAEVTRDSISTPNPGDDVAAYRWVSKTELEQMVSLGSFFRYSYIDRLLK